VKRKLIVNADDFGMSEEVNQAIVLAHRVGLVSSTTVLVNGEAADDLRGLRERQPRLGVGLHLSITDGKPLSEDVPTLLRDGRFHPALALLECQDQVVEEQLQRELRAQFARFVQLYGGPPDHLDVHQYSLAFFPVGLHAYLQFAAEHGLPVRSFADWLDEQKLSQLVARVERTLGVRLPVNTSTLPGQLREVAARFSGLRTTAGWLQSFSGTSTTQEVLGFLRDFQGDSLEWMCHPALSSDIRRRECEMLTSPELVEAVSADWELTTFAAL
jgi:predicted glycoside hydrolase/deacetylase ChbG (UPF0249 family)